MQRTDDDLSRFLVSRLEQAPAKVTQPTVSLLKDMRYTPASHTDLRESFRRIKEQQATQ
jgi:hypothetical protein